MAAKRTRTETNEAGQTAAPAKTNGAAAKKAKAAYDENDDGFQFSRARSKKTQPKALPAAEPTQERSKPAPTRRKRNSVSAPAPVESDAPVRRRRSARLSEDKEQIMPAPEPKPRRTRKPAAAEPKVSGDQNDVVDFVGGVRTLGNELHVEKKRDGGATKIALPFADTPIIRRNKEMRKGSSQGHRRSSAGMRGRRASSLIDSGASNAVPHAEVETRDFYKHIEQSLPEPRRMKQLLTWCGARALPEKPSGNVKDINAIMAARAIQQELLDDFASTSEMSDWFSREDTAPSVLIKKPNPQNERNASMLQELEQEIKRLQEEKAAWEALTASSKSKTMPPPPLPSKSPPRPKSAAQPLLPQIDPSLLDPSQTAILAALQPQPPDTSTSTSTSSDEPTTSPAPLSSAFTFTSPASLQSRLTRLSASLEPTVDLLADGVHKISQYRLTAERVADRILGSAAERLEQRDRDARERAGTEGVGVGDVLGALGRMLHGR